MQSSPSEDAMRDIKISFLLPRELHRRLVAEQRRHPELRSFTAALLRALAAGLDALDARGGEGRP
jgi:hypothetical protein